MTKGKTILSKIRQKNNISLNYEALIKVFICECFKEQYKQLGTAENNPNYQSNNIRISNILSSSYSGRGTVRFGNTYLRENNQPMILMDSLGGIGGMEGQPGGCYRPLRNKF
jgi:hypothetical protein